MHYNQSDTYIPQYGAQYGVGATSGVRNGTNTNSMLSQNNSMLPGFHGPNGRAFVPVVDVNNRSPLGNSYTARSDNKYNTQKAHKTSSSSSSSSEEAQIKNRGVRSVSSSKSSVSSSDLMETKKKKKGCCGCCGDKKNKPQKAQKSKRGCCGCGKKKTHGSSSSDSSLESWSDSSEANEFGGRKRKCCGCGPRTPNRRKTNSNFGNGGKIRKMSSDVPYEYAPTSEVGKKKKCCC